MKLSELLDHAALGAFEWSEALGVGEWSDDQIEQDKLTFREGAKALRAIAPALVAMVEATNAYRSDESERWNDSYFEKMFATWYALVDAMKEAWVSYE